MNAKKLNSFASAWNWMKSKRLLFVLILYLLKASFLVLASSKSLFNCWRFALRSKVNAVENEQKTKIENDPAKNCSAAINTVGIWMTIHPIYLNGVLKSKGNLPNKIESEINILISALKMRIFTQLDKLVETSLLSGPNKNIYRKILFRQKMWKLVQRTLWNKSVICWIFSQAFDLLVDRYHLIWNSSFL